MNDSDSSSRVAVLGGGVTGLTAAWHLRQAGLSPVVFEKSARVGGAIGAEQHDGWLHELGPNSLLEGSPEVAAFIESIRGTLAGDRKALESAYELTLQGSMQDWELVLTPIDSKMKKMVERIRISGVEDELRTIEISQADGDSSLMTIQQTEAQ